jgi:hypothetical protein
MTETAAEIATANQMKAEIDNQVIQTNPSNFLSEEEPNSGFRRYEECSYRFETAY